MLLLLIKHSYLEYDIKKICYLCFFKLRHNKQMSSSRFEIKRVKKQPILSITKTVKVAGIGAVFAQIYGEISAYMAANGWKQVSSPVAIYHSFSHNEVEVEAGIPVSDGAVGNGDIELSATPSGTIVMAKHFGPYETLEETHEDINEYISEEGHAPDEICWEVFVTDPTTEPNPEKWETLVCYPIW